MAALRAFGASRIKIIALLWLNLILIIILGIACGVALGYATSYYVSQLLAAKQGFAFPTSFALSDITGYVTEFGRKQVGDHQLFGLLGKGKKQIAYAKVSLNIIDSKTSETVFSTQGAGEYELSSREVLGFGSSSSYDSTLNGKVLDLAIREAVDNLVIGLQSKAWQVK